MQRVLERPGPFVTEKPCGAIVRGPAWMALDFDKEQSTWSRYEKVNLAYVTGARGERERLPGSVRLRIGHLLSDVPESVLFPWEVRLPALPLV